MRFQRRFAPGERMSRLGQRRFVLFTTACMVSLVIVAGCRLAMSRFAACPLSYEEQKAALLKIVPLGTPRDQAVKKLKEAGIRGDFGIRNSVYYCDSWEQETGEQWYLDLALLFDKSGQLYEIRPERFLADSQPANGSGKPDESQGSPQKDERSAGAASAATEQSAAPATANAARSGRRTPFAQAESLPTM